MRYEDYKKVDLPWLKEVPSHWDINSLKKFTDLYTGNSIPDNEKNNYVCSENSRPYISTKDISKDYNKVNYNNGMFIKLGDPKFKVAKKDSTLVCIEGGSGGEKVAYLTKDVSFVNKLCCFKSLSKNINDKFIYYFVKSNLFKYQYYSNVTGDRNGVSLQKINYFQILIPPKEEQEQIARFLDWKINEIDALVESEYEKIELIKRLIKSNHSEFILGKLKNKLMNFTDKEFINGIPDNWKVVKLKKILKKIEIDADENDEIVICSNHGYSFYRGDKKVGLTSDDNRYYQKIEKNQIMIHGMDTWHGAICISNHSGKCTRVVHVCETEEDEEYIVYYLRLLAFMGMYKPYSNGVRQNTSDFRSWNVLGNIDIILPPIVEQNLIVNKLNNYIQSNKSIIKSSEKRVKKLKLLKQSLISDVVTGKIDVRNVDIPDYDKVSDAVEEAILEEDFDKEE